MKKLMQIGIMIALGIMILCFIVQFVVALLKL